VTKQRILEAVREICLGLPETSERPSHGAPTFCPAPEGVQAALVEADPDRCYVPAYVGHRGWIGVRLDRGFDRDEIAGIVEDAYAEVAPPKLVEAAGRRPT
jgi:hypothetical protein